MPLLRPNLWRGGRRRGSTAAAATTDHQQPPNALYVPGATCARLQPSKTVAMSDLATSMRREGIDVISLAPGEPDFDTPAPIAEAGLAAIRSGLTHYSPNAGIADLREAIASKLARENGVVYDGGASSVVVTNGAKQAIAQTILATCSPGDEVLVPSPYWVSYPEMAKLAGATPVIVETDLDDGFLLSAETLSKHLTPRSRVLILCSPSNPTGSVYTKLQLEAIAAVVQAHPRLLVIADEIYEHIHYPPTTSRDGGGNGEEAGEEASSSPSPPASFASLPKLAARTVTVNGFSKAFAMTGWRVGYLAAPEAIARDAAKVQSQFTSGASTPAQHAAVAALRLGEGYEDRAGMRGGPEVGAMVAEFRARRDYACSCLADLGGLALPGGERPGGAFYLFPDASHWIARTGSDGSDGLCAAVLREAGVALVPGSAFGKPDCVRMSYAASLEDLERAFDKIGAYLARF